MVSKETKLVKNFYSSYALKEWKRLDKDAFHRLEFDTTMLFLKKYLPKKGLILDAGSGPGRYSIELAKKGYDIVLFDLVKENLELAEKKIKNAKVTKKIKKMVKGSITDLSEFENDSFDAVLCLGGALSHVHPEKKRKKSVDELLRVAKKGAPVFVSVMGKFGTMVRFTEWPDEIKDTKHFERFYKKGDDYMWHGGESFCHFFELEELKKLFGKKTVFLENVGLEGFGTVTKKNINSISKEPIVWKNWLRMHYETCTDPRVAELSQHFMVIYKKK